MSIPADVFRVGDMVIRIIVLWIEHHRIINYRCVLLAGRRLYDLVYVKEALLRFLDSHGSDDSDSSQS